MAELDSFIPLKYTQNQYVRAVTNLPFELDSKIGLNLRGTVGLMQLSGIKHVKIVGDPNGEESKPNFQIVGIDRNGGAVAGKSVSKTIKMEKQDLTSRETDKFENKQSTWADLTITLNTKEIQQKLLDSKYDLRQPDPWANYLNESIKRSFRSAGTKNLLSGLTTRDKYFMAWIYGTNLLGSMGVGITRFEPQPPNILGFINMCMMSGIVFSIFESFRSGKERLGSGRRTSLFYGLEVDRALMLNAVVGTTTLIKSI